MKYLILLGLSLGLVACNDNLPISGSNSRVADVILDRNNPCVIYITSWNKPDFAYVAKILGCDPNQNQRLPE